MFKHSCLFRKIYVFESSANYSSFSELKRTSQPQNSRGDFKISNKNKYKKLQKIIYVLNRNYSVRFYY
ncbi:hypothetical protein BpHYR1_032346 [Brachionus plicatilis]|uniref:Uncharacterized protein n=1 Tax=Brachionus plicatilis TaxID=10195 RepID=A0A3M7Q4C9_BRAPC|nr:hypothetical protein BpHYR1_032346 [Brachionus plicatilis]